MKKVHIRDWILGAFVILTWLLAIEVVHLKIERTKMQIEYQMVELRAQDYYERWIKVVGDKYEVQSEAYAEYDEARQISANSEAQTYLNP